MKKPDLFRSGFLPLSPLATNCFYRLWRQTMCHALRDDISLFLLQIFCAKKSEQSLKVARELQADNAWFDDHIVKCAAGWGCCRDTCSANRFNALDSGAYNTILVQQVGRK
jgi:hypothetical protein